VSIIEKYIQNVRLEYLERRNTWWTWHRWENNIKMDLRKIGCEGFGWIQLVDFLVSNGMNPQVPQMQEVSSEVE
jgi:hypothetical protein